MIGKLGTSQKLFAAQRFCEYGVATRQEIIVQFQLSVHVSVCRMNSGSRERQQRANVLRHNKMPRGTHDMRAQYRAVIKGFFYIGIGRFIQAQCQRPLGSREVLCLYRAQSRHHFAGRFTFLFADQLIQ
jgi:hypothetical protein